MPRKILVIGHVGSFPKSKVTQAMMMEKYGKDIILVTPEEANEQGLELKNISNIPTMKITPNEVEPLEFVKIQNVVSDYKTGQERRRERRAKERKAKNRNK